MKIYFLIIALFTNLTFVNCRAVENEHILSQEHSIDETLQKTINYARRYRIDTTLSLCQEEERQKGVLEAVCANLVSYESDSLENGIRQFLQDTPSLEVLDFDIIDVHTTEFFGKSKDILFLIKDYSGQLCYVVKAFRKPQTLESRFLQEISAIDLMQQLKLPGVVPIEQYAFALCNENNNAWGLLLESVACGKRLDQYVYDVGREEIGSDKRTENFEIAKRAFKRMGISFAHLHSTHASSLTSVPSSLLGKCDVKLAGVLSNEFIMKELSKRITISDFLNYVEEVKNTTLSVTFYYTYVHGDAHLGNIFYDEAKDSCCFIDLAGMHRSIDIQGQPILHGTIDVVRFEDSLRFKANNLLTEEEVKALHISLYEGYEEAGGQIPDERLFCFYNMYVKIRRLVSKSGYVEEQDPRIQASDKLIFEDALHYFEKHINQLQRQ